MAISKHTRKGYRNRKRRPVSQFVSETLLSDEKTFATGSQFDAGYVKRKVIQPLSQDALMEQKDKWQLKAITPARRLLQTPVIVDETDEHHRSIFRRWLHWLGLGG